MDTLSPEQRAKFDEFVLITDVNLDEPGNADKSAALLSHHDFNLNNAVLAYFDSGLDLPEQPEPVPESPHFDEPVQFGLRRLDSNIHFNMLESLSDNMYRRRLPKAPPISNTWQFEVGLHMSRRAAMLEKAPVPEIAPRKPSILWIILLIIPRAFLLLFSFLKYIAGFNAPSGLENLRKFDYDNYEEGYDFKSELEDVEEADLYNIATSDFNKVHEWCKTEYNFLVILLVDDVSASLVKNFLRLENVKEYFDKKTGTYKDTQMYISNVTRSPEAFEVAKTYRKSRSDVFPLIVLAANVSNDPMVMSSMSLLFKLNLVVGPDLYAGYQRLGRHMKTNLQEFEPQLVVKKYDKHEIEMSRLIKEQQDEAYQESLQQDKVKKQEKDRQLQAEAYSKNLRTLRNKYLTYLGESGWFQKRVEDVGPQDLVRLAIKLPNGRRIIQKFSKSAPLNELHLFVELQLFEKTESEDEDEDDEVDVLAMEPSEYYERVPFGFELFKPMPKLTLPASMESIEEFGKLHSGDNVLVEYLEEEQ